MRQNLFPTLEFVTWQKQQALCFSLAKKLKTKQLTTIVSVSRGGHVVSRILSDLLKLPIFNVSIQSYTDLRQEEVSLTQKLGQYLAGERVLLTDEIVDSGKTLQRAVNYLRRLRVKGVISVALYVKPKASPKPDLFCRETDNWVVFPYEVRETVEALTPRWKNRGWNELRMKRVLTDGGLPPDQVDLFLTAAWRNSTNRA